MADDKKSQDEYQYPPEEYYKGGEYLPDDNLEPLEPEEGPRARSPLPKRLLWLLGFILAIAIVYLILTFRNTTQQSADLTQATPAAAQVPSTISTVQQAATPLPQTIPVDNPTTDAAMQRLTMQNQSNQQSIANMQSQIQQLQSQLNDLTNSISTLGNQIQVLSNEIKAIGIDRAVSGRSVSLSSGTVYHLRALVPGRAWLESPNGKATTVTIGDRLPGYGIIQMININQGIVTTSSGAIIEYGPRDS